MGGAACPDGFMQCRRWPTESERDNICAEVSNINASFTSCKKVVQEQDVKEIFDLMCDDTVWKNVLEGTHFMHRAHNDHHWHHFHKKACPLKKWFSKMWPHGKHHGHHGKHHHAKKSEFQ